MDAACAELHGAGAVAPEKGFHDLCAKAALKAVLMWRSGAAYGPLAIFLEHECTVFRVRDLRSVVGFLSHIRK